MTQQTPTFNVSDFELRNYTNPWLTPAQSTEVAETEDRVNSQLDFLAQMLGWNGPNYWDNLPASPDQKRQLLGGSFGVYDSYIIPRIYEVRNWDNSIVVDRLQFILPGRSTNVLRVVVGEETYQIRSISEAGDKFVVSLGELSDAFYDEIAAGTPVLLDIPNYRPAPFYRPQVGISGDNSFVCTNVDGSLVLYPSYDSQRQFPYKFPIVFAGSVYYFDQPIYFSQSSTLSPDVEPTYDEDLNLWFLKLPESLESPAGLTGYFVWANTGATLEISIQTWVDSSDWGSSNVLDNFRGVWGNKGGDLPFNFVFDALSIHGFNESNSVYLPRFTTSLNFDNIVNHVYYQKTVISDQAPGGAEIGDIWWNDSTGALAVWLPGEQECGSWVEIDYRNSPRQVPSPQVVYPDVATFQAQSGSLSVGAIVLIQDITGLSPVDNVIGVQGTLTTPGQMILHRETSAPYWTVDEIQYAIVADFEADATLLPYKIPVVVYNSTGLAPSGSTYEIQNLPITITGDYEVLLMKYYTNTTWEIVPDSILKYIASSALFKGNPTQGAMWWDFANPDPNTRSASIFYSSPSAAVNLGIVNPGVGLTDGIYTNVPLITVSGGGVSASADVVVSGGEVTSAVISPGLGGYIYQIGTVVSADPDVYPKLAGAVFEVTRTASQSWVNLNTQPPSGPPVPVFNMNVILFYCDGALLQPDVAYVTDDFTFTYSQDSATGEYTFDYNARTFTGRAQFPTILISDSLTTVYRADISSLVFSGVTLYMSPNVYDAETPLRLWKGQSLQVAETLEHLAEDNYINPLRADLNSGPGPENWEKYFVRMPLDYGRNEDVWQKVALICQDFAYWGSSIEPEIMDCPPEDDLPIVYEELFIYDQPVPDYTYVYCENYLYSNIAYVSATEPGDFLNSGVFPASDIQFDEFNEAEFVSYDPLHNRQANVTSPVGEGYGNWVGEYVNINPCVPLTGYFTTDLLNGAITPVEPPVWDASIYKYAPTCESDAASFNVDANHYKIGYAYFVADASAAEDAFFDIQQEAAWRYPVTQPKTSYLTPR